jgi:undecaprenyl-diphosphatase
MSWWQSVILGLVEGVTEYLPVSSTGHLILAQRLLGIPEGDAADAYAVCIQVGAILAVLGLYRLRAVQMVRGVLGQDPAGRRLFVNVVVAFLPALVLGGAFSHTIKEHLFGLWPVVVAWFVGGVAILGTRVAVASARVGKGLDALDVRTAALIGLCQCLALWPGTSRSLVTILGAVLLGMSLEAAVEFSFLLGLLTLTAATAHDVLKYGAVMVEAYGIGQLVLGGAVAAVAAGASVRWLVGWLQAHGLALFAGWRIGLALIVAALLLSGVWTPV